MKRRIRPIFFVCSAIDKINGKLLSKMISAVSKETAIKWFMEQFSCEPEEVFGPFYQKIINIKKIGFDGLKLSNQFKKAIYNDWIVNAFPLKDQMDKAFLLFIKRNDDKKVSKPKGNVVVSVSDLKFI